MEHSNNGHLKVAALPYKIKILFRTCWCTSLEAQAQRGRRCEGLSWKATRLRRPHFSLAKLIICDYAVQTKRTAQRAAVERDTTVRARSLGLIAKKESLIEAWMHALLYEFARALAHFPGENTSLAQNEWVSATFNSVCFHADKKTLQVINDV